jgi:hypothetical protein
MFYRVIGPSVLLNDSDSWTLTKEHLRRMETAEMRSLE